jgi:hypothetical protein
MSIGSSSETLDLNNNNSSRINTNNLTAHETQNLSISINSNSINNTAKISNTGINQGIFFILNVSKQNFRT